MTIDCVKKEILKKMNLVDVFRKEKLPLKLPSLDEFEKFWRRAGAKGSSAESGSMFDGNLEYTCFPDPRGYSDFVYRGTRKWKTQHVK